MPLKPELQPNFHHFFAVKIIAKKRPRRYCVVIAYGKRLSKEFTGKCVMDRRFFQVAAFVFGILLFTFGTYYLYEDIATGTPPSEFSRFGIAATACGAIFLIAAAVNQLKEQSSDT